MIRQGDVLLVPTDQDIDGERIDPGDGRNVLAEGEATGHAHTVCADASDLIAVDERTMLKVFTPTWIEHQEHTAIEVAPGNYWVVRQREYSPEAVRFVTD